MTFKYKDIKFIIHQSVLDGLNEFRQTGNKFESGGIILGSIFNDRIEILKFSIPTPFDKCNRFGFVRDKKSAKLFIDYEFINSRGKIVYLGEWHTHPEDYPTPSNQDNKMIKEQYKVNIYDANFVLMLILGRKGIYLGAFEGKLLISLINE